MSDPNAHIMQSLDADFRLVCIQCKASIVDGDFYVVVHQYADADSDAKLAVHARCAGMLP